MLRSISKIVYASLLVATPAAFVSAQNFIPPSVNTVEHTFPNPGLNQLQSTSAYSVAATYLNIPSTSMGLPGHPDMYVSGWNNPNPGGNSEVSILLTQSDNPSNIFWQGSLSYNNVRDLEVGCVGNYFSSSAYTSILVAYYLPGQGHRLDIYNFNGPAGNPLQLIDQKILSNSPTYGRIRLDCKEVTSCAVAWINPGVGIQTMVHKGQNTWSAVSTLNGTATKTMFDVALTSVTNTGTGVSTGFVHFVYPNGAFIVESSLGLATLSAAVSPVTVTPTVNDNNYVGTFALAPKLVLDCTDFSNNGSSWAYTYTDGMQISVRHKNPALPGTGQTAIITAGVLANSNPLDPTFSGAYQLFSPSLNYGMGTTGTTPPVPPNRIMVSWYATDNAGFNGYIAAEMDESGTTLTSDPDFLLLPNGQTPTMPAGFTPGVTLCKIGIKSVPNFLYATYYDIDPATGDYQLHHAFHNWGDTRFRPGDNTTGITATEEEQIKINAFPSPFSNKLSISVTLPQNGKVDLVLTDISGRKVWHRELTVNKGIHLIEVPGLDHLTPGTYMLTSTLNKQKVVGTSKIIKR